MSKLKKTLNTVETLGILTEPKYAQAVEVFLNNTFAVGVLSYPDGRIEIDQTEAEKPYNRMVTESLRQFIKGINRLNSELTKHANSHTGDE